jgi:hypothetical protein
VIEVVRKLEKSVEEKAEEPNRAKLKADIVWAVDLLTDYPGVAQPV